MHAAASAAILNWSEEESEGGGVKEGFLSSLCVID